MPNSKIFLSFPFFLKKKIDTKGKAVLIDLCGGRDVHRSLKEVSRQQEIPQKVVRTVT